MAGGRIRHWKHGWIPISPEAKAYVAGKGPRPITERNQEKLREVLQTESGFTYDFSKGKRLIPGKAEGFAVAVPGTREKVGFEKVKGEDVTREDFARGIADIVEKHSAALASGDFALGGWYDPETNDYTVELTRLFGANEKDDALQFSKESGLDGVFDMKTGELSFTQEARVGPGTRAISLLNANFTREEIAAAKYYTGPGFAPLNRHLRFGASLAKSGEFYMNQLDSAISKATVPEDTTVFRGVYGAGWLPPKFEPGAVIEDAGYMSTAIDPAGQYDGDTKWVIKVPAGAQGLHLDGYDLSHHSDEAELLLPRGTKLRVISDITPEGADQRIINMEVVTDGQ